MEIFSLQPKGTGAKSVAIVTSYYVPCCTFLKGQMNQNFDIWSLASLKQLRGSVPKNGPIDFASKNHFPLNSADGKSLVPKY